MLPFYLPAPSSTTKKKLSKYSQSPTFVKKKSSNLPLKFCDFYLRLTETVLALFLATVPAACRDMSKGGYSL